MQLDYEHFLVIATYNTSYRKREINHKNIDAVETAGRFGIDADQAVDHVPNSAGTELNIQAMSGAVSCYRSVGAVPMASLDMIRKNMKKRGKR